MKYSFLLLSSPILLLISSSILSQTTGEHNTNSLQNTDKQTFSTPSLHRFDEPIYDDEKTGELLLANVSTESINTGIVNRPIIENENSTASTEVDNNNIDLPLNSKALAEGFSDEELAELRQLFLQAEDLLKNNKDAEYFLLADELKEYPLYPYLQYQWLKKHLDHERQVKHFLTEYKSSRYAGKLKHKWLHHLARHKQWPLFLQFYTPTKETKLNCYYHTAQFNTGDKLPALEGARNLWTVGYSQPRACDPLFAELKKSSLFTQDLLWQRFDAALQNNKYSLAVYIKKIMPKTYHPTAQLWLSLHRDPSRYMQKFLNTKKIDQSALMFTHAINRLTNRDVISAIELWDTNARVFNIDKELADKLERRLAFKLAYENESGAYDRLGNLNVPDNSSRTWRIRVALSEQNWPNVLTALQALDEAEIKQEKWQYWLARAYLETGEIEKAEIILSELSTNRSFYGYLAADKVNSLYQLSDNPVAISAEEITQLKNRKEYRVAFELMVLEKENEAKLQWWHALNQLNKDEIIVAAKLAQRWQWDEIAIFTIAKAKYWDDIEIRFPLSYADKIQENSIQQKLNPVILYGLIRRESAFNKNAYSPAGARGLMQIMPRTGRQIAKHFNERWRGSNSLYNPVTNIKYGSYYYQKLLNQFDGHYAIALAAYNAGPERVKRWLPETETLPADIWIETIPYQETREYVASVLAYALIYQQRTQSSDLSMNDLTRAIQPLGNR